MDNQTTSDLHTDSEQPAGTLPDSAQTPRYRPPRGMGTSIKYDPIFGSLAITYAAAIKIGGTGEEEFARLVEHIDQRSSALPHVVQRSCIIEATAALLRVDVGSEAEQEELLKQVRKISAALDLADYEARNQRLVHLENQVKLLTPKAKQYDIEHPHDGLNGKAAALPAGAHE